GHDLHLLSHTLHDWGEERVRDILERSFAALSPCGWLVDHDTHLNGDKTGPLPVARYSVLLMHTTSGRCWSVAELEALLVEVGFTDVEQRPAAGDRSIVMARKPA
ncbi:MAG TPA: methyltransferase, partial [Acidimicrobiales bacterium]|nr:methyltransferase [Acidimicrobiales bacterium]